jgi:hypothetical protein
MQKLPLETTIAKRGERQPPMITNANTSARDNECENSRDETTTAKRGEKQPPMITSY